MWRFPQPSCCLAFLLSRVLPFASLSRARTRLSHRVWISLSHRLHPLKRRPRHHSPEPTHPHPPPRKGGASKSSRLWLSWRSCLIFNLEEVDSLSPVKFRDMLTRLPCRFLSRSPSEEGCPPALVAGRPLTCCLFGESVRHLTTHCPSVARYPPDR